jgi:hypothetical protein
LLQLPGATGEEQHFRIIEIEAEVLRSTVIVDKGEKEQSRAALADTSP